MMMNILNNTMNFDGLARIINSYGFNLYQPQNEETCLNIISQSQNQSTKVKSQKDIESLMYPDEDYDYVSIEIYEDDSFFAHKPYSTNSTGCIGLPIGSGCCYFGSLIWSRPSQFSDFEILYKGYQYRVNYKELDIICKKIKIDFESVIKTYIENNMDATATIYQFLV
jgi:hypothetical protein